MKAGRRLAALLVVSGCATTALAFAWWWATYGDVVGYGYLKWGEASRCLVGDSDLCALARTLCRGAHPRALIAYSATAFWLALGLLSISAFAPPAERAR